MGCANIRVLVCCAAAAVQRLRATSFSRPQQKAKRLLRTHSFLNTTTTANTMLHIVGTFFLFASVVLLVIVR